MTSAGGVSVLALVLQEFSRLAVAEQARLKSQLEALAAIAIQPLLPDRRIVLDVPDGLVVVILGDVEDALDVAQRVQAGLADLPLCIALNHGPVKALADSAASRFAGDGIVSALALANLAGRGRCVVSRSFRDALGIVSPQRAGSLVSLGAQTDATLRAHELFTPDPAIVSARRRRLIVGGGAAACGVLALGVTARVMRVQPAVIEFDIQPRGDIYVDGELRGTSPPLSRLAVGAGARLVEVRHDPYPPLRLQMNLKPAEAMKVTHSFSTRRQRREGDSFVEDVWRRLSGKK